MGVLFSRFRRKQTTIEILEDIDKEINSLQRNRKVNQDRQKQVVTSLLIYSIVVYVFAAVIFFLVYFPDTWQLRFLYSLPLLIFPFLIWGIKKLLHWYFVKRISSNDLALQDLRERKKQILEDVMETETYKRARDILEKFDPARLRKFEVGSPDAEGANVMVVGTPGTVIQQRTVQTIQQVRSGTSLPTRMPSPVTPRPTLVAPKFRQPVTPLPSTPAVPRAQVAAPVQIRTPYPSQQQVRTSFPSQQQVRTPFPSQPVIRGQFAGGYAAPASLPMARSVLPRERGTMDRLMDYLVGDGPENRYALICQQCYSHNGMALREEFEYLSFRCCYCYTLNPAKKQRPLAPRLEFFAPAGSKNRQTGVPSNEESDDDDIDKDDEDYSDVDSLESDTSAGISPLASVNSPTLSPNPSTSLPKPSTGKSVETPKPKESAGSKPLEVKGPKLDQTNDSISQSSLLLKRTEEQASKVTMSRVSNMTGSLGPKVQEGLTSKVPIAKVPVDQVSKVPVAVISKVPVGLSKVPVGQVSQIPVGLTAKGESSADSKNLLPADKVTTNEGSDLPGASHGKMIPESVKEVPDTKTPISVPTVQTPSAGPEVDQVLVTKSNTDGNSDKSADFSHSQVMS